VNVTARTLALRALKPLAFALACLPLAKLATDAFTGGLGANPIAEGMNRLGFWTLTFLTLTLAATPLQARLGWTWPVRVRRALGLLTFGYAALHLVAYAGVDQALDWSAIWADVAKRPFITVGFATFLTLLPLAVTSTDGWVRRLGFRAWKRLHRLAYLAALGGILHFVWRVKIDLRRPLLFATLLGLLLLSRLLPRRARSRPAA
jgi:methionine sulfoxide reductase heme-binding subunit